MGEAVRVYQPAAGSRRTRSSNIFAPAQLMSDASPLGLPVSIMRWPDGSVARRECGLSLAVCPLQPEEFWDFLRSWGGDWMWEYVEGKDQDLWWLTDALASGTAVLVTDGSYDRKRAPTVSGAGWVITCQKAQKFLHGSFYEHSRKASAYRGELLGLVAIHTLALALVKFYRLNRATGKLCCDNINALFQSEKNCCRVRTGATQADLLRSLRTLKCHQLLHFSYEHVRATKTDISCGTNCH